MASHHPEGKGVTPWGWIIAAVVAVIVVVAAIFMFRGEPDQPMPEPGEPVAAVEDYGEWVRQDLPDYEQQEEADMAADGFERIADALEGLRNDPAVPTAPVDAVDPTGPANPGAQQPNNGADVGQQQDQQQQDQQQQGQVQPGDDIDQMFTAQLDSIRANADRIRTDEDTLRHGEYARSAAMAVVEVMRQIQEHHPVAGEEVDRVAAAAEDLETDQSLTEQRSAVEMFFREANDALQAMDPVGVDRDIRDEPGALPTDPDPGAEQPGADEDNAAQPGAPGTGVPNN